MGLKIELYLIRGEVKFTPHFVRDSGGRIVNSEPQNRRISNIEYRMSKGGIASLSRNKIDSILSFNIQHSSFGIRPPSPGHPFLDKIDVNKILMVAKNFIIGRLAFFSLS